MSTNMADAVYFNVDMATLHQNLLIWRERIRTLTFNAVANYFAQESTSVHDKEFLQSGCSIDAFRPVFEEFKKEINAQERGETPNPFLTYWFRVFIVPYRDKAYGMINSGQREWTKEFTKLSWVESKPYWNHTDHPDDVTDEEWERRGILYNKLFLGFGGKYNNYSASCLQYDCTAETRMLVYEENFMDTVKKFMPTLAERALERAKDQIITEKYTEITPPEILEAKGYSPSIMQYIRQSTDYATTREGKKAIRERAQALKLILPQTVNLKDW